MTQDLLLGRRGPQTPGHVQARPHSARRGGATTPNVTPKCRENLKMIVPQKMNFTGPGAILICRAEKSRPPSVLEVIHPENPGTDNELHLAVPE